ncbi:glycosyltransferase [Adhaeribacter arboris]|nr:glycosyltransferase [Adhaeribacter arboris]
MKKTRILLSSVLKPVNDTRMFEKIGATLARLPHTEVHIAGFPGEIPSTSERITFHPFHYFKRISWGRIKVQYQYWQLLRQLRPQLLIISTHELLFISIFYKLLYSGKIWYDVRENYFLNLTTQNTYSLFSKYIVAYIVRMVEYLTSPFINYYLLAERSYATELPFLKNKYIVLENKFKPSKSSVPTNKKFPVRLNSKKVKMLYSGTISEMYGIFEAVELARQLHQQHPGFSLTIIGYCAFPATLQKLQFFIQDKPYITLIGGDQLVPHQQVIQHIQQSDVGLLPYQPHPSTFNCTPTKLFEYLANGLPVLVQQNPYWANRVHQYQAGINLNFRTFNAQDLIEQLQKKAFFPRGIPTEMFWETEESKLIQLFTISF